MSCRIPGFKEPQTSAERHTTNRSLQICSAPGQHRCVAVLYKATREQEDEVPGRLPHARKPIGAWTGRIKKASPVGPPSSHILGPNTRVAACPNLRVAVNSQRRFMPELLSQETWQAQVAWANSFADCTIHLLRPISRQLKTRPTSHPRNQR